MTPEELVAGMKSLIAAYETVIVPQAPPYVVVQPADDLAAAFATGKIVHLVNGQTYGGITLPTGARLVGNGAAVVGVGKPALYVAPGSSNIEASDLVCTSNVSGAVVQLGDNGPTQTLAAQAPSGIALTRVTVPTHRGKRGFELNAANVRLEQCSARDVYTTTGQDSSALGILGSPGGIVVNGGTFEGGSECVLFGGDDIKMADAPYPTDVEFNGCTFTRPLSWQTDGVLRVIKNIFEVKNGRNVRVLNCTLENCWTDGQTGVAITLTPTRMGVVQDILIDGCTVRNCGQGVQITGSDASKVYPPEMWTTGIVIRNSTFTISKAQFPGTGRFLVATGAPKTVDVENCTISMDGTSFVYVSSGKMDRVRVVGSTFNCGSYGFNIAGGANLSLWSTGVTDLTVTGNTMTAAATALKNTLAAIGKTPVNTYV